VPRGDRARLLAGIEEMERRHADWEYEQIGLDVGGISVRGMLQGIERMKENGEDIIVLRFWEN
jgi:hypothetical protein